MDPEPINEFEIYVRVLEGCFPLLLSISCAGTLTILVISFFSTKNRSLFRTLHHSFGTVAAGGLIIVANRNAFLELTYISGEPMPFRTIGDLVIRGQFIGGYIVFVGVSVLTTLLPKSKHNKTAMDKPDHAPS